MPEKEPLNRNQAELVDNDGAESSAEKRNIQIEEGNYIENLGGDYYQNSSEGSLVGKLNYSSINMNLD